MHYKTDSLEETKLHGEARRAPIRAALISVEKLEAGETVAEKAPTLNASTLPAEALIHVSLRLTKVPGRLPE